MIHDLPELLRVEHMAEMMGVHPVTVRGYCRDGVIPAKKIGRIWLIPRDIIFKKFIEMEEKLE